MSVYSFINVRYEPEAVKEKARFGDWESDTVEFKRKKNNPFLSVQYERKSQLLRMNKMLNKTAEETKNALIKTMESLPERMFETITFDNGTEGTKHIEIKGMFNIETYFCDPYSPWQKGGVENMNRLIRQYLPRNTNMSELSNKEIYEIQEKINNRPRKGLNYLTPNEVIHKVLH